MTTSLGRSCGSWYYCKRCIIRAVAEAVGLNVQSAKPVIECGIRHGPGNVNLVGESD